MSTHIVKATRISLGFAWRKELAAGSLTEAVRPLVPCCDRSSQPITIDQGSIDQGSRKSSFAFRGDGAASLMNTMGMNQSEGWEERACREMLDATVKRPRERGLCFLQACLRLYAESLLLPGISELVREDNLLYNLLA